MSHEVSPIVEEGHVGSLKIQNGAIGGYKSRRSPAVFPLCSWTWRKVGQTYASLFMKGCGRSRARAILRRHLVSGNASSPGTYKDASYMSHEVSPIGGAGHVRSLKIQTGALGIKVGAHPQSLLFAAGHGGR